MKKPGSCTIPARKLYDYIKLLPDGDISIKLQENHWVQIRSGRSNTKMVGMARANFPQVPEFPTVRRTRSPSPPSEPDLENHLRHFERGVALHPERRAAHPQAGIARHGRHRWPPPRPHREEGETRSSVGGEKKTLIPRKALAELQSLLSNTDAEQVEFADDDHTLFFRIGKRVLTSRKLTGQFPNYEAVIPRDNNKFIVVRSRRSLGSIQRVAQFADERSGAIKMRLEQNELKISSSSTESGESEDTIETPYKFDALVVGFNSAYMLDFLKAIGTLAKSASNLRTPNPPARSAPKIPRTNSNTATSSCLCAFESIGLWQEKATSMVAFFAKYQFIRERLTV